MKLISVVSLSLLDEVKRKGAQTNPDNPELKACFKNCQKGMRGGGIFSGSEVSVMNRGCCLTLLFFLKKNVSLFLFFVGAGHSGRCIGLWSRVTKHSSTLDNCMQTVLRALTLFCIDRRKDKNDSISLIAS